MARLPASVGRQPLNDAAAAAQARREAEVARALGGESEQAMEETPVDTLPRQQRKPFVRKPFGTFDQKLAYPSREGFHRHWFNDEPGRQHTIVLTSDRSDEVMGVYAADSRLAKALLGAMIEQEILIPWGQQVRYATILRIAKPS